MTWTEQVFLWIILVVFLILGGCRHIAGPTPEWKAGEHYKYLEPGDAVPWPGYLCKEELLEWALGEEDE